MPDVRLIDANAVVTIQVFDEMTEEYEMQTMTIAEMIDRWSDEGCPPTVDAVPVVRCRECKKRQDPRECPMCFTEVEDIEGGRMYKFTDLTRPDGFCHMGEKIDGGATDEN